MKIFLISAAALSLVGGAAIAQPNHHRDQGHDNHSQGGHQWSRGQRLPSNYRTADHYVDYRSNHLRRPAHGHRWVRTDNGSYAEIALATGLIYSISH
jgi:Ni/Co efflux regulator RcnB